MTRMEYYSILDDKGIISNDKINKSLYCEGEPRESIESSVMIAIDDVMIAEGMSLQERIKYEEEYNVRNYVRALITL